VVEDADRLLIRWSWPKYILLLLFMLVGGLFMGFGGCGIASGPDTPFPIEVVHGIRVAEVPTQSPWYPLLKWPCVIFRLNASMVLLVCFVVFLITGTGVLFDCKTRTVSSEMTVIGWKEVSISVKDYVVPGKYGDVLRYRVVLHPRVEIGEIASCEDAETLASHIRLWMQLAVTA
jgi:hypothetical protein